MTVYTVHEPPPGKRDKRSSRERIQFVRDGFYFWAFVFGPFWMMWRRMWLVLLLYILALGVVQYLLWVAEAPVASIWFVAFLIALLIGFEAGSLRRWSLRRWLERGIVVAPNLEQAEQRFFEMWPHRQTPQPQPQPPRSQPLPPETHAPPAAHVPTSDADVIGLFPQPEPRR